MRCMTLEPEERAMMIELDDDIDVRDVEPMPLLWTLKEAKQNMERIYEFVVVNNIAGASSRIASCSNFQNLMRDA